MATVQQNNVPSVVKGLSFYTITTLAITKLKTACLHMRAANSAKPSGTQVVH